ncbi:MAG: family 20 glycosylhydrolase [Paludibacteraceae bacterium]|nr:family 20 glycosylhydrolase [Paludibacteraceae bacterium]
MKKLTIALVVFVCLACTNNNNNVAITPLPLKVEMSRGKFTIGENTSYYIDASVTDAALLRTNMESLFPQVVFSADKSYRNQIEFLFIDTLAGEAYELNVSPRKIEVKASSGAGFFYALQTLKQCEQNGEIPCMRVYDSPRFAYRGMHLDVSRHFFSVDFIKKQLDMMAHYKLNRFHWHLTDGAGWRIEIKRYPRLTEFAAWRQGKWKAWWAGNRHYCEQSEVGAYGGYYTQEEVREIVAYAAERHITIIPEIEMPGHSEEVLATYPQLACSGKPYTNADLCIGNEETFEFLQNVLTEVMELFPSKQIHIGGDEAGKSAWKTCPKCQRRMHEEQLANVDELQSYLVHRIEDFLKANGRELVGWNEIMAGGVSQDAIVMAWTNEAEGFKAARAGNRAIMVPGAYCYFDMYQANPATQPEAIGGYINLEKVYGYNPAPIDSLTDEQHKNILGVQANLWTEYVPTEEHAEQMIYPRLLALAEIAWTKNELKNWDNFKQRANAQIKVLQAKGYNAFSLSDEPNIVQEMFAEERKVRLTMSSERYPVEIRYTTDGSEPTSESMLYTEPIEITDAVVLSVALFDGGKRVGPVVQKPYGFHKALGKTITYNNAGYGKAYSAGGDNALVDGITGSFSYTDGCWQGFSLNDMDVTIDLDSVQNIESISATFMQLLGPWVWLPTEVEILVSNDNENFIPIYCWKNDIPTTQEGLILKKVGFEGETSARFIRYKAKTCGIEHGWMFIDEIVVM